MFTSFQSEVPLIILDQLTSSPRFHQTHGLPLDNSDLLLRVSSDFQMLAVLSRRRQSWTSLHVTFTAKLQRPSILSLSITNLPPTCISKNRSTDFHSA